ncbi:MAG: hypothetical protein ACP5IZ_06080 [Thermoprotei archaeon]|jgi:uncharacterized protein YlbG (UPF0298 family)
MSELFKNINNISVKIHRELEDFSSKAFLTLEAISKYQTSNVAEISRRSNIPVSTLHKFIAQLLKQLRIGIYIDLYTIGLKPHFLALYNPDQSAVKAITDLLEDYCVLLGTSNEENFLIMKIYIPEDTNGDVIELLERLKFVKKVEEYDFYTITSHIQPPISFKNYDEEEKMWKISWESIINNVNAGSFTDLDERLKTIKKTKQWLDEVDIEILKLLDTNAFMELIEIQRKLNEPKFQKIYYHYTQHISKKNMILGFKIKFIPYEEPINYAIIYATFSGSYDMAKFIEALTSQLYVYSVSRVIGEPSLLIELPIHTTMKTGLDNLLEKLKNQKFIRTYKTFYVNQITEKSIPYHLYNPSTETWTWKKQTTEIKLVS